MTEIILQINLKTQSLSLSAITIDLVPLFVSLEGMWFKFLFFFLINSLLSGYLQVEHKIEQRNLFLCQSYVWS